jgi:hypothetical protein
MRTAPLVLALCLAAATAEVSQLEDDNPLLTLVDNVNKLTKPGRALKATVSLVKKSPLSLLGGGVASGSFALVGFAVNKCLKKQHDEQMDAGRAQHDEQMRLQGVQHDKQMRLQDHAHNVATRTQKEQHEEVTMRQDKMFEMSMRTQKERHDETMGMLKERHDEAMGMQKKRHDEAMGMQKERHDEAMRMQKEQHETLHTQNHRLICVAVVLFGLMFVKLTKMEERHDKAMGMQKERLDTIDRSMTTLEGSHRDSQTLVSTQLDAHEERLQVMQLAVIKARAKTFDIPTPPGVENDFIGLTTPPRRPLSALSRQ